MQRFKMDIYERENGGKVFPVNSLNQSESDFIFTRIVHILNIDESIFDKRKIYTYAYNNLDKLIRYENEVNSELIHNILIKNMKLSLDSNVFIYWDNEIPIDALKITTLINDWEYIWYDVSDEAILIYNDDEKKLALITEQGYIKTN